MNLRRVLVFLLFAASATAWSQPGSLTGRVIDARTLEPLPFASIFINNTTLGTASDAEGNFTINSVPPGSHDVVYSFVGYESYQARINVRDAETIRVNIKLAESEHVLDEVAIKESRDKVWEKQLKKFTRIFMGDDEFGRECRIVNPWVIDLQTTDQKQFTAKASLPVEILNDALGYKLFFHLKDFTTDGDSYSIVGNVRFEERQPPDANTALLWTNNRKTAYNRSARHFFKALIEQRYAAEGFRLYHDSGPAVPVRTNSFASELEKNVKAFEPNSIIGAGASVYELKVQLKERIEVHYVNEPTRAFFYRDVGHAVSWLETKSGFVRVTPEGVVLNPKELIVSGDMSLSRVAELLPFDYQPDKALVVKPVSGQLQAARYQEKVHLHTNKPYYYPGEIVWTKSYMRYRDFTKKDSLSRVLYIELLNPSLEVIESRSVCIDSLQFAQFRLSEALQPGLYLLRAYTNWMLNFGESEIFNMPLPVLDPFEKLVGVSRNPLQKSEHGEVHTDKDNYGLRELVNVTIDLNDSEGNPSSADLSVAVVDLMQVASVGWSRPIVQSFEFSREGGNIPGKFPHHVEYGLTAYGRFVNERNKPVKEDLTFIKGNFEWISTVTSDAAGRFQLYNLDFFDSARLAFQARKKGTVTFAPRQAAFSGFRPANFEYKTEKQPTVQRVLSIYEMPGDATMLQEVTVNASRIVIDKPVFNTYGQAEKVITQESLSGLGGSLGVVLQRLMPGYSLAFESNHWYFIRNRSAISSGKQFAPASSSARQMEGMPAPDNARQTSLQSAPGEPLLMIDNALFVGGVSETVGDRLQSINPSNVERVEVNSVTGSLTGSLGAAGVVNIYMKKGGGDTGNVPAFQMVPLKGFDTPIYFRGPDYANTNEDHSKPDFRSTLYWHPQLSTDPTGRSQFSFYTSDLPGTYLITIEGMLSTGIPFRAEHEVQVVNK